MINQQRTAEYVDCSHQFSPESWERNAMHSSEAESSVKHIRSADRLGPVFALNVRVNANVKIRNSVIRQQEQRKIH